MATATPMKPSNSMMATDVAAKTYFTSLPRQPQVLNLRANMGISDTSSQQLASIMATTASAPQGDEASQSPAPTMSEAQKSVLAGVGRPMNDVDCRSSRLNLASLKAENAAMMKRGVGQHSAHRAPRGGPGGRGEQREDHGRGGHAESDIVGQ